MNREPKNKRYHAEDKMQIDSYRMLARMKSVEAKLYKIQDRINKSANDITEALNELERKEEKDNK